MTYHILDFSFTTALRDIHGLKEASCQNEKANSNGIHVSEGACTFIKISWVTQSSPHLFSVVPGRTHAVYCKYVQVVNSLPALTEKM